MTAVQKPYKLLYKKQQTNLKAWGKRINPLLWFKKKKSPKSFPNCLVAEGCEGCGRFSHDRPLTSTFPAAAVDGGEQIDAGGEAGEDGGSEVDLVQAVMFVDVQVAVGVLLGFVDHDPNGGQIQQSGGNVVDDIAQQPPFSSEDGNEVLLVQKREHEDG